MPISGGWSFGNLIPTLQPTSNLETALATIQVIVINGSSCSAKFILQADVAKLTGQLHAQAFSFGRKSARQLGLRIRHHFLQSTSAR